MSSNTFSWKRFLMLFKQHYLQNNKLLLYAAVAYIGVIFLLLTMVQLGNDRAPHDLEIFGAFIIGFVSVFGILFTGYSFPAFRRKESAINYLMVPASTLEKFLFEFLSRLSIVFILLPTLFWMTFHFQGYFFNLFSPIEFQTIGFGQLLDFELPEEIREQAFWVFTLIISLVLLAFVLPFTGGAIFSKQPLIKTLFAVAIIVIFYAVCIYVALETLGVGNYQPNDSLWLFPHSQNAAMRFFGSLAVFTNVAILIVAYKKLKEKEV
jgi:hypothetical protein